MSEEEKKKESGEISRREFLKDAGLVVGGAAIGSTVLLAACGEAGETATVTETATQTQTQTVTTTQQVGEVTTTVTQDVSKFICPYDGQEFGTLAALQAHVAAEHPEAEAPAVEGLVTLIVNGETHYVKAEDNWTLAYVLREKLGFTGTKRGCDDGSCGWCTLIMDGRPVLSCLVLAVEADGKELQTIEGLAKNEEELHPIQRAFIDNDAMQCGICIPGTIMTAKALLDFKPKPTRDEVREALAGTLCRCGSYQNMVTAVLEAAK